MTEMSSLLQQESQEKMWGSKFWVQTWSVHLSCRRFISVFVHHPQLNVLDACLCGLDEFSKLLWRGRCLQLKIVSKRMVKDGVVADNIREGCGIQTKEGRSQNRSLWDSIADGHWGRASFWQLQPGFFLWGEIKITSREQYCVCQKHVQDAGGERYGLLYQKQLIGQTELEQIRSPGHECVGHS